MKTYLLAIATILLFSKGVYSQTNVIANGAMMKSDKDQMADVDKMMQEIKANLSSYTKTENVKDSNRQRYTYTKAKELKQITVYYKDGNIDKYVVWYFNNGQLIYSEQVWTDRATKNTVDNEKFYLHNDHLFAWFKADKQVDTTSEDFKKMADSLKTYASQLEAYHSK